MRWSYSNGNDVTLKCNQATVLPRLMLLAVLCGTMLIAFPSTLIAQNFKSCRKIVKIEGKKVVLGDIAYSGGEGLNWSPKDLSYGFYTVLKGKMNALPFGDKDELGRRKPPEVIICEGRKFQIDGTDFTDSMVKELNRRDVLLEIYARIRITGSGSNAKAEIRVFCALIPVYRYGGVSSLPRIRMVRYEFQLDEKINEIAFKLQDSKELEIYAAISYAIKLLKNQEYDNARDSISKAQGFLQEGIKYHLMVLSTNELTALQKWIDKIIKEIIDMAKQYSNYNGSLTKIKGIK